VTGPFRPTTSLGNLVERLRRAFNLVGDVPIALGENVTTVVNAEDLTRPGYGTYRGRSFKLTMDCPAGAANTYRALKAVDTVVLTRVCMQCDTAGFHTVRLVTVDVPDPAGWTFNQNVVFSDRCASANDFAPVTWMGASSLNAPAASGVIGLIQNVVNFTFTPWFETGGIVLESGDRLAIQSSAAVGVGRLHVEGYVF